MRAWRMPLARAVLAAAVLGPAAPLSATYSIAATDSATGDVGGAVTSCVGALDLAQVYGSVPGVGVIHAQAQLDTRLRGRNRALELLMAGRAPADIVLEITAPDLDSQSASRQYGIVDVMGRSAGFTGSRAQAYRADQQGSSASFHYSVQGNILTSQRVLDQATEAFVADSCDLAERLMRALEAGGDNGEGDSRCTGGGIPSDAAFIEVDRPDEPAGSYLRLSVSDTGPDNPLPRLRELFDAWRTMHPCAVRPSAAGSGGSVAAAGSGGAAGVRAVGGAGAAASSGGASGMVQLTAGTFGSGGRAGLAANGGQVAAPAAGMNAAVPSPTAAGAVGASGAGMSARGGAGGLAATSDVAMGGMPPTAKAAETGCIIAAAPRGKPAPRWLGILTALLLVMRSCRRARQARAK